MDGTNLPDSSDGNWRCPTILHEQMERLRDGFLSVLGRDLIGIYVHGSLGLGGFNPQRSDIDLLVVVRAPLTLEIKLLLAALLISASGQPCPVEVTLVTAGQLRAGEYPTSLAIMRKPIIDGGQRQRAVLNLRPRRMTMIRKIFALGVLTIVLAAPGAHSQTPPAGAAYVPVDPASPPARVAFRFNAALVRPQFRSDGHWSRPNELE
jgi:streptomycin 3"-adenylyltransferase